VPTLPPDMTAILSPFAPVFSRPVRRRALVLLMGAILAPGARMLTSVLRGLVLGHLLFFQTCHWILNRAVWSSLTVSRILLGNLVATFAPRGTLVIGIDETIERRRGAKIATKGIYPDPVRSSHSHFVRASGLRWICMMQLVPIPWVDRTSALPFLTVLVPSERYHAENRQRYKSITDWARQMIRLLRRQLVIVGVSEYVAINFLAAARHAATIMTRLRLDARLFAPAPPRRPRQVGRPRLVGNRLPSRATRSIDPGTVWTTIFAKETDSRR
jgi:DDE superfamily endonuclease